MESSRLDTFIKSVSLWPHTITELHKVGLNLKHLLCAPVVLIWLPELGVQAIGLIASKLNEENALIDFISANATDRAAIRQVQLSTEFPFPIAEKIQSVAVVPLTARKNLGWVLIGSDKALNAKDEILLASAINHLNQLATIHGLKSELSMRDQFMSIASHELKTPLTSIYGILQLQDRMLKPKPGTFPTQEQEKQRSFFKIVIRQVERLNELIDGLLDVSRIQNGRFMVEPSETDVAAIVRDTIDGRLTVIANEAGVKIQVEAPNTLKAFVDPVRFEEVITNLVMNAIRFSPEGGVVWVRLKEADDQFIVSIRDQGPSIPEGDRERVFRPFEQAQRTTRLGGLGLGLFISRQIAQLHHGNVVLVEGSPGRGNVLEVRFPIGLRTSQVISA